MVNIEAHSSQPLLRMGVGSYSDVFKIVIDRHCKSETDGNKTATIQCELCKWLDPVRYPSETYAIKQINITDKFGEDDFEYEVKNHRIAYDRYPTLFTFIGPAWLITPGMPPLLSHDVSEVSNLVITAKPADLVQSNPSRHAYIVTEFMDQLDLYSYYTNSANMNTMPQLSIKGLLLVLLIILDTLHNSLNMVHGDLRDRNIFIKYKGPGWKQIIAHRGVVFHVDVGGYEVKLGDFGLVEDIQPGRSSFIIRDFEFLENIYCQRENWQVMTSGKAEYDAIVSFIRKEFMLDFYALIAKIRLPSQTNKEARRAFWFNKHRMLKNSVYYYELPKSLLKKYVESVYNCIGI